MALVKNLGGCYHKVYKVFFGKWFMKDIKVFLQYPWKFPDSAYYRNMLAFPPKGVTYLNKNFSIIDSKRGFEINRYIKEKVRRFVNIIKIPNLTYARRKGDDLIHCAHCLSLNKRPWVVDFERYENLTADGDSAISKRGIKIIRRMLKSDNCKRILPWTNAAKESLLAYIDDKEIKDKIKLLPFGMPVRELKPVKRSDRINVLFVARHFQAKGGIVALEVIDRLTKKYKNVYGLFVSSVPKEMLKKYGKNKKIEFYNLMSHDELLEKMYPRADVFFYPGIFDTFGFMLVEALSFKLPIVTFEGFARDEIVENGKNGFIIRRRSGDELGWKEFRIKQNDKGYINEAVKKTGELIANARLRRKMGAYGYEQVKTGKFSIKNRNKILKEVYLDALN